MGYADATGPMALVHRGGGALAPENTLEAFALSAGLGYRYLESDVRVSSDDRLVCFHDATLDRVTDGTGPVAALDLAELTHLRVRPPEGTEQDAPPAYVCSLEEALTSFPDAYFSVDLKEEAAIGPLVRVLRRRGVAERVCVAGAWDGWLAQVRDEVPGVATSLGWRSLTALITCVRLGMRPPRQLATAPFAHVPMALGGFPIYVDRVVEAAHGVGVRVVTWTIDDPAVMERVLDAGVDAVITDRPDALREVLLARGQWQPMSGPRPRRRPRRVA